MTEADYRLMTETTGQRIAAALEALSGTGAAAAAARTNLDVYSKGETDTAIARSTAIKTVTQTINATGAWITTYPPSVITDLSRIIHINMNGRWIIWRYTSEGRVVMLRLNTAGTDIVIDDTTGNVDVTYYYI